MLVSRSRSHRGDRQESWLRTGLGAGQGLQSRDESTAFVRGGKWQILIESVPAVIRKKSGSVWKQGCERSQQSWSSPSQEQKANTLRLSAFFSVDLRPGTQVWRQHRSHLCPGRQDPVFFFFFFFFFFSYSFTGFSFLSVA